MDKEKGGKLIVIEGNEGCGKSTQAKLLAKRLQKEFPSAKVIETSEPWDNRESPTGRRIKRILNHQEKKELNPGESFDPVEFQTLYIADRHVHWEKLFLPEIENGSLIVSDRERLSTYAFMHAFGGSVKNAVRWHRLLPAPDITIYIRTSPETSASRIAKRKEKVVEIFDTVKNVKKILKSYEYVVGSNLIPNTIIADGEGMPEEVHERIWKILCDNFSWSKAKAN
jgi:dTMP kinase